MSRPSLLSTMDATSSARVLSKLRGGVSSSSSSSSSEDPLDLVRRIVQKDLNQKIYSLLQEYIRVYFQPAAKNVEANLGLDTSDLLEQTCINALEHAKGLFRGGALKRPLEPRHQDENKKRRKDDEESLSRKCGPDTLFVLGSKAKKAMASLPQHAHVVFRYLADQEDKDWLAKELHISTTGGKASIMVYEDVVRVVSSFKEMEEVEKRRRISELRGFNVPDFMLTKMKTFESTLMNDLLGGAKIKKEEPPVIIPKDDPAPDHVQDMLLNEIKDEEPAETAAPPPTGGVEDDLGFLHGMNLTSLVREFEMEAGAGFQHLGIFSLADDPESFSELSNEVQESFDNIEFN
uniref:Deoxynucleotidyltransferase terminal-interacting protein 1 n=1 Tax=Caligus clemensi TaxID=344056 RepID=C1C1I7_CALCM|nr:Deoxynucleotidyltransferase terminal-interacting protein 1 [Caligus clemensi]